MKVYSIGETVLEAVYHVLPRYSNPVGTLHGGIVLDWMVSTATMAASRIARGPVLLASLDHVFFVSPVPLGWNAVITSWVEFVGESSMMLSSLLEAENPATGEKRVTTLAHMVMVAVGPNLRPRPVGAIVKPTCKVEDVLFNDALRRRSRGRMCPSSEEAIMNVEPPRPLVPGYSIVSHRFAYPEDTAYSDAVHAGRLLYFMDELAGITGLRYARGPVVTASVDYTCFYSPIRVGETIELYSALTFVGGSSMEVTLKAIARNEITGEERHSTTAHFTVVHLDFTGRPAKLPPYTPSTPEEEEVYREALRRRRARKGLLEVMRERFSTYQGLAGRLRECSRVRG